MNTLRCLIMLYLISAIATPILSAEPLEKMSDMELFERALIQIELHKNYQKHKQQMSGAGGYGRVPDFFQNPSYGRWADLYSNYSAYRDEIIKRSSPKSSTEHVLRAYLVKIKDDIKVTVLTTVMLDRIKNPEKYKRLDALRKKMLDDAAPLAASPWRNLTQQARVLVKGLYDKDKSPYETGGNMPGMMEFDTQTKPKGYPAKEFTKNSSIEFLCEMALTNQGAFKGYSLILLGQFKKYPLALKTLNYAFGDFDEEVRGAALEGIALTGDMETVRKALEDKSEYIRKVAAKLLLQEKNKKQQPPTSTDPKNKQKKSMGFKSL